MQLPPTQGYDNASTFSSKTAKLKREKCKGESCCPENFAIHLNSCVDGKFCFNPIALRRAKTLWSFGLFECNWVNSVIKKFPNFCLFADLLPGIQVFMTRPEQIC